MCGRTHRVAASRLGVKSCDGFSVVFYPVPTFTTDTIFCRREKNDDWAVKEMEVLEAPPFWGHSEQPYLLGARGS